MILLVWALIAGQPTFASHKFSLHGDCEITRALVIQQLRARGAEKIVSVCTLGEPT